MTKECSVCGSFFNTRPSLLLKGWGKFCSPSCYQKYRSNKKKTMMTCANCGKEFPTFPSRIIGGRKFCSKKCMGDSTKGEKSRRWNSAFKYCAFCGDRFKANAHEVNSKIYCSNTCKGLGMRGDKSVSWKGGVTPYRTLLRNSMKYITWRTHVFKRDNFTCQKCGQRGGSIHAHHKKRFAVILNDIKQMFPLLSLSDIADNYHDLWDIQNGITLCKKCHIKTHGEK